MKKYRFEILGLGLVLALGVGCFRNTESRIDLDIPAMKTEACAKQVSGSLQGLGENSIVSITTNLESRSLVVIFDNVRLGRRNIEVAVRHAGFAVNDLPADEEMRAKLPPECRGDE
jgi:copper chaperone CopZ